MVALGPVFELGRASSVNLPPVPLGQLQRYLHDLETLPIHYHGNRYASCNEAACGEMLRRYIPGFDIVPGETFQIPIYDRSSGKVYTIDFGFGSVLLEFHPTRFWREGRKFGDFRNAAEYFQYRHRLRDSGSEHERKLVKETTLVALAANYYERRRSIIDRAEEHRGKTLIVASSPEELYHRVIKVYGEEVPPLPIFLSQFRLVVEELKPQRRVDRISARWMYRHDDQQQRRAA